MTSSSIVSLPGALKRDRVLGIIRASSLTDALAAGRRVLSQGLCVVEVSATTPEWDRAVAILREEFPSAMIGAGTILDLGAAQQAVAVGAQFLVSPGVPADLDEILRLDIPVMPGVFSPSDIMRAIRFGITTMKLYPAHVLGPAIVRALTAPFPSINVVAVGGISYDQIEVWTAAGALAVGLGSELDSWSATRSERA